MAYFDGVHRNISLRFGFWWEEYWKYWAELISNIDSLFDRQNVSVGCSYRQLYIWPGSGAIENLLLYVESLPLWATEFGKLRKTVVRVHEAVIVYFVQPVPVLWGWVFTVCLLVSVDAGREIRRGIRWTSAGANDSGRIAESRGTVWYTSFS